MSNSFNISALFEIAAVKTVVDANKIAVDNIHDTDLPAVKTDTGDIRNDVTAIHDTDLPSVKTFVTAIRETDVGNIMVNINGTKAKVDANKLVIDDIHDIDLPAVHTRLTSVEATVSFIRNPDISAVKTVVDANKDSIILLFNALDSIYSDQPFLTVANDAIIASADTQRLTVSASYEKLKEIKTIFSGEYRISFDLKATAGFTAYGRIYRNDVAYGTERSTVSDTFETFSEDLIFISGDLVQLYLKTTDSENAYCLNFRLKAVKGTFPLSAQVVID